MESIQDLGCCIPLREQEIKNEINYIQNQIEWFNESEIQNIYLMRKEIEDRVILFTTTNKYLIYHSWRWPDSYLQNNI